jgi:hypothetical protein
VIRWALSRKKPPTEQQEKEEIKVIMSKEVRLQELLEINTSVRTPEQKAKALLKHLFTYI